MSTQGTNTARQIFHGGKDAPAPAALPITRGCVVTIRGGIGPRADRRYLVMDTDNSAGIAYLSGEIGETSTYAADDARVARVADLTVSPDVCTPSLAPVTPIGADRTGERLFPADVVAAYQVLTRFLATQSEAA